jgi:hypothetical protein
MLILAASIGAWHSQAYVTDGGREAGTPRARSADLADSRCSAPVTEAAQKGLFWVAHPQQ